MKPLIVIGAGGQGNVVAEIAALNGYKILGYLDDALHVQQLEYPIIGNISQIPKYKDKACFIIGIGNNVIRKRIQNNYSNAEWVTLIHPQAHIASQVSIGEGTVIMAGVIINIKSKIGSHCIINTGTIVEHDNKIGDFVHLSPGCCLGGSVLIDSDCWLGVGATVINNIKIGRNIKIGAGAVVIKNLIETGTYVGIPAKLMIKNQ